MKKNAVRLHHDTLRNCVFTIQQQSRIYPSPYPCPECHRTHIFKTFHLNLNAHGDVCVSEEIYQMLRDAGIDEQLTATKEVTPAPTFIDMGAIGGEQSLPSFTVFSREEGPISVPGLIAINAIEPPSGMFRREPDGTWTDLAKP